MIFWRYRASTTDGGTPPQAIGTPVEVFLPGLGHTQVAYQFGDGSQTAAVVDLRSGAVIARIEPHHTGAPQERARLAAAERLRGVSEDRFLAVLAAAPTLNTTPEVLR